MKHRSNKSKSGRKQIRGEVPGEKARVEPEPPRTRRREWAFRLLALSLLPLLLGLLEIGLRLGGYGYPTDFFKPLKIGTDDYLVQNDEFGLRFFPREISRKPDPLRMLASKPPGRIRIFILGESAALGDPDPAFGAGRYLGALLRERFPNGDFEIVNVAFTAINSHVILPIARECVMHDGDVWIIYMGNNEMVGPFGAATVFGAQAPPRIFVRSVIGIQKTRVGQLLMAVARKLSGPPVKGSSWGGMEMFQQNRVPPDSIKREAVRRNFQENLDDILQAGFDARAKIILNTVAVNLKDSPPFASMLNSNLPAAERKQFEENSAQGKRLESEGDFGAAARSYEQALKQDGQFAEARFRLGNCLLQLTNIPAAAEQWQLACDNDALPFRADSRINSAILDAARRFAGKGVTLLDAAAALGTNNPATVCGQETFYEHVHFNFDGNYRLGRAWAEQVARLLPESVTKAGSSEWASQAMCERRLGLTDWNRVFTYESVIGRLQQPLLGSQFNNAARVQWLHDEMAALRRGMNPTTAARAGEALIEAIKLSPKDPLLHENFAKFLESTRNFGPATAEWERVCELMPHDARAFFQAGRLRTEIQHYMEAGTAFAKAVALRPHFAEAWFELGNVHLRNGATDLALEDYQRAARLAPSNGVYRMFVGKALSKLNRPAEAIEQYREAIRLQPDLWLAHFALGDALATENQFAEAGKEFADVIRLRPTNAQAHLNLGLVQFKLGQSDQALRQFEETLRLEPGNQAAREYIARIQGEKDGAATPR